MYHPLHSIRLLQRFDVIENAKMNPANNYVGPQQPRFVPNRYRLYERSGGEFAISHRPSPVPSMRARIGLAKPARKFHSCGSSRSENVTTFLHTRSGVAAISIFVRTAKYLWRMVVVPGECRLGQDEKHGHPPQVNFHAPWSVLILGMVLNCPGSFERVQELLVKNLNSIFRVMKIATLL